MKNLLTLTLVASSLMFACNEEPLCLTGSGQANQYTLDLSSFDRISLSGPVNLNITQGAEQQVVVVAEPEMFSALEYGVQNSRLDIGYDNVRCFNTTEGVYINVTLASIEDITFEGAGTIQAMNNLQLSDLSIGTSGDVKLILKGNAENLLLKSDGAMEARNYQFISQNVSIDIQGSADLELNCSQSLNIELDGYAKVSYLGQPQINQQVLGALDLINAN